MKKTLTLLLLLTMLVTSSIKAQVYLGELEGTEKKFTSFQGELFFAKDDSVFTASTLTNEISFFYKTNDEPIIGEGRGDIYTWGGQTAMLEFPATDDHIFFLTDADDLVYLYRSDGTAENTEKLINFDTAYAFTSYNNHLFFVAQDSENEFGHELWKVEPDGQVSRVSDLNQGPEDSFEPAGNDENTLVVSNGVLYFFANDGTYGNELYKLSDVNSMPVLVEDLSPGIESTNYYELTAVNEQVYFVEREDIYDRDTLYISDGTTIDFVVASEEDYSFINLVSYQNSLVYNHRFSAGEGGPNLVYITQGEPGDTTFLAENYLSTNFMQVGDLLFFTNWSDYYIDELWRSDGTPEGTEVFYSPAGVHEFGIANIFVASEESVYFPLSEEGVDLDPGVSGAHELTVTDLTQDGTTMVKNMPGEEGPYDLVKEIVNVDGVIFFARSTETAGDISELYYFDPGVVTANTAVSEKNISFDVFPNPATSIVNIKAESGGKLIIFDSMNKVVIEKQISENESVSTVDLPSGIYLAKIIYEDGRSGVKKFIKK